QYWTPTLKLLGIRYRRPYCTRSTCATIGLMSGANPAYMANQLGHGLDVFFKDYAAWINGDSNSGELKKIEARINKF
ncbi:MAG: integrase, partial [Glaciimonas sp.]|nr:integrase [Glaciimonas sp.]